MFFNKKITALVCFFIGATTSLSASETHIKCPQDLEELIHRNRDFTMPIALFKTGDTLSCRVSAVECALFYNRPDLLEFLLCRIAHTISRKRLTKMLGTALVYRAKECVPLLVLYGALLTDCTDEQLALVKESFSNDLERALLENRIEEIPAIIARLTESDKQQPQITSYAVESRALALATATMNLPAVIKLLSHSGIYDPSQAFTILRILRVRAENSYNPVVQKIHILLMAQAVRYRIELERIRKRWVPQPNRLARLPLEIFTHVFNYTIGFPFPLSTYPSFYDAIRIKDKKVIECLIAQGFSPFDGLPLHAERSGQPNKRVAERAAALIFPLALNSTISNPLHYAARYSANNVKIIEMLIAHGAQVNTVDAFGRTALHQACRGHSDLVVKALLHHGANPDILDHSNRRAQDIANQQAAHACTLRIEKYRYMREQEEDRVSSTTVNTTVTAKLKSGAENCIGSCVIT